MSESTDDRPAPSLYEANEQHCTSHSPRQTEEVKALIMRLNERLRKRDRRIKLLELALARTVLMHQVWASHLERKLDRSFLSDAGTQPKVDGRRSDSTHACADEHPAGGVVVHLPHLTRTLEALFDVMREHWTEWDPERPPKSSTVARAIDDKLGLKGQANGEASRSAQTFAAAIRPDFASESDGRHR
ncbi:hypothetical protein [Trinickia sp. EG282A]|uniref:hypothetical protein n=1 Tax=Trinickia sp. EG282A TaxID=3237013 RepID=UPI0034D387F7